MTSKENHSAGMGIVAMLTNTQRRLDVNLIFDSVRHFLPESLMHRVLVSVARNFDTMIMLINWGVIKNYKKIVCWLKFSLQIFHHG
jgi:hypothetical protein